jgi:hypothetical protein
VTSRPPNYYAPLKETERQVSEALNRHQEPEPERPERQVHPQHGWTEGGGMLEQQASAMEWVRASAEQRRELAAAADSQREASAEHAPEVGAKVEWKASAEEITDKRQAQTAPEMTDQKQALYDRWTGQLLDAMQTIEQSRGDGQGRSR